jgi:hypothetical protein
MGLLTFLNASESQALNTLSAALSTPSSWLYQLIDFESGWNPQAINPISGAGGLIQFTNTTAQGMGYTTALNLIQNFPDRTSQLTNPVYRYLRPFTPFPTQQSLNMAVFYPAAREWPLDAAFPENIQEENPGIITVNDYMKKVGISGAINTARPFVLAAGIIAGALWLNKLSQKDGKKWEDQPEEETI